MDSRRFFLGNALIAIQWKESLFLFCLTSLVAPCKLRRTTGAEEDARKVDDVILHQEHWLALFYVYREGRAVHGSAKARGDCGHCLAAAAHAEPANGRKPRRRALATAVTARSRTVTAQRGPAQGKGATNDESAAGRCLAASNDVSLAVAEGSYGPHGTKCARGTERFTERTEIPTGGAGDPDRRGAAGFMDIQFHGGAVRDADGPTCTGGASAPRAALPRHVLTDRPRERWL